MLYLNTTLSYCSSEDYIKYGRRDTRHKPRVFNCIITSKNNTELNTLLDVIGTKPVFAMTGSIVQNIYARDPKDAQRYSLSKEAKRVIFNDQLEDMGMKFVNPNDKYEYKCMVSPEMLIIPTDLIVGKIGGDTREVHIRNTTEFSSILVTSSFLLNKDNKEGYIDPEVMTEPLNILEGRPSSVNQSIIANQKDIADAIWSARSRIKLTRIYNSKTPINKRFMEIANG